MTAEIIYGVDFKSKSKPEDLKTLADKIFAEALDVGGPDLWAGQFHPNGIDDLPFDGKEPA